MSNSPCLSTREPTHYRGWYSLHDTILRPMNLERVNQSGMLGAVLHLNFEGKSLPHIVDEGLLAAEVYFDTRRAAFRYRIWNTTNRMLRQKRTA
jgi:hypothetical protein